MEATSDRTRAPYALEHIVYWYGEYIRASKSQLQALGIGVDVLFPGEPGAAPRRITVRCPRGYLTVIQAGTGGYCARVYYPGRDVPKSPWIEVAPGLKRQQYWWSDKFTGTSGALVAAGLVSSDQLQGLSCRIGAQLQISADGAVISIRKGFSDPRTKMDGAKLVKRRGENRFHVEVVIPHNEGKARRQRFQEERDAAIRAFSMLSKPLPLQPARHLRLVWSAPREFQPHT